VGGCVILKKGMKYMRKKGVYFCSILLSKTRCMLIIRYIATKNIKIGEFCFGVLVVVG